MAEDTADRDPLRFLLQEVGFDAGLGLELSHRYHGSGAHGSRAGRGRLPADAP